MQTCAYLLIHSKLSRYANGQPNIQFDLCKYNSTHHKHTHFGMSNIQFHFIRSWTFLRELCSLQCTLHPNIPTISRYTVIVEKCCSKYTAHSMSHMQFWIYSHIGLWDKNAQYLLLHNVERERQFSSVFSLSRIQILFIIIFWISFSNAHALCFHPHR